jgi:hypothetical protein
VSGQPGSILSSDLDGDGRLDLVVTGSRSSAIVVLAGDGRGGFTRAAGPALAVPLPPHLVAAGDLDRDGKTDLAATAHDSHGVWVWRGDGRFGFTAAPGSPFPALAGGRAHNHGLALADVDGDADLDVLTTDDVAHVVAVLRNDGRGALEPSPRSPFSTGSEPYPPALADLNGDGRLDVITPDVRAGTVSVLLGDGQAGFAPATAAGVTARPYFVATGDVDGDGKLDAVVTHDDVSRVTVLVGDGRGGLRPATGPPLDAGRRGWKAALHDMDRDGRLDLVLAANGVVVMLGDGRGGFSAAPGSPFPTGRGSWSLALGDFDADGRTDAATADFEAGTVSVLLQR